MSARSLAYRPRQWNQGETEEKGRISRSPILTPALSGRAREIKHMHDFHQHLSKQLAEHLAERAVVVWYDPRREFTGYVAELAGGVMPESCRLDTVTVGDVEARLCCAGDSLYGVKFAVEGQVAVDQPEALILYLPGCSREQQTFAAGRTRTGRDDVGAAAQAGGPSRAEDPLRRRPDRPDAPVGERDLCRHRGPARRRARRQVAAGAMLSVIFAEARGDNAAILADWLGDPAHDPRSPRNRPTLSCASSSPRVWGLRSPRKCPWTRPVAAWPDTCSWGSFAATWGPNRPPRSRWFPGLQPRTNWR